MKILCVVPSYWPAFQFGGPIFSQHALNKALVKRNIDVNVYTTNVGLAGKVPIMQEVDIDGVKVTYFTFTNCLEFLAEKGWQFSLPIAGALKRNLRTFDIIYIVSIWNYPVAIGAHYCRKYNKPYIISPRGLLYPYATKKKFWKKWLYYNFIVNNDLKTASAIHYTTKDEAVCHSLLGLKNRAIIIPNGVDLREFSDLPERKKLRERYPALKNKKIILFLGRIHQKKGLDILIRAYGMLASERDDVHLLIAGDEESEYGAEVKMWLRECKLADKVTFLGMLLGRDKLDAYITSDVFVLSSYSENFGMAVIEAMACGLPVIISDKVGIYEEVKENNAGLIISCNAESLYNGIKTILDNQQLAKSLSSNARTMVERYYNIETVADRVIDEFNSILLAAKH